MRCGCTSSFPKCACSCEEPPEGTKKRKGPCCDDEDDDEDVTTTPAASAPQAVAVAKSKKTLVGTLDGPPVDETAPSGQPRQPRLPEVCDCYEDHLEGKCDCDCCCPCVLIGKIHTTVTPDGDDVNPKSTDPQPLAVDRSGVRWIRPVLVGYYKCLKHLTKVAAPAQDPRAGNIVGKKPGAVHARRRRSDPSGDRWRPSVRWRGSLRLRNDSRRRPLRTLVVCPAIRRVASPSLQQRLGNQGVAHFVARSVQRSRWRCHRRTTRPNRGHLYRVRRHADARPVDRCPPRPRQPGDGLALRLRHGRAVQLRGWRATCRAPAGPAAPATAPATTAEIQRTCPEDRRCRAVSAASWSRASAPTSAASAFTPMNARRS